MLMSISYLTGVPHTQVTKTEMTVFCLEELVI